MKKTFIIIIILFLSIPCIYAQQRYIQCLDTEVVKWSYVYELIDSGIKSQELVAFGDTLINNVKYKKIYLEYYWEPFAELDEYTKYWKEYNPVFSDLWNKYFIRESEDASKLYIYSTLYDKEYLISDLDLREGDEFQIPLSDEIVTVDSIYIKNGLKQVRFNFEIYATNPNKDKLTFIEGVGPNSLIGIWDWSDLYLNCFQNISVFYKNKNVDEYFICPCGYRSDYVGIESVSNQNDDILIDRNNIEFLSPTDEDIQISIYDVYGKLFYNELFRSEQNVVISVSPFPKGIYILKIRYKSTNQIKTSKFIL